MPSAPFPPGPPNIFPRGRNSRPTSGPPASASFSTPHLGGVLARPAFSPCSASFLIGLLRTRVHAVHAAVQAHPASDAAGSLLLTSRWSSLLTDGPSVRCWVPHDARSSPHAVSPPVPSQTPLISCTIRILGFLHVMPGSSPHYFPLPQNADSTRPRLST